MEHVFTKASILLFLAEENVSSKVKEEVCERMNFVASGEVFSISDLDCVLETPELVNAHARWMEKEGGLAKSFEPACVVPEHEKLSMRTRGLRFVCG